MFSNGYTFIAITHRRHTILTAVAGLFVLLVSLTGTVPAAAQKAIKPPAIKLILDMNFGSIVATAPAGTVTLFPSSAPPQYNGVISVGGVPTAAVFRVRGQKLQPFTIILPTAPVIIPGPGGAMIIDSFVSEPPAGPNGMLDAKGKATVTVGATMQMTDQLTAGPYNSTFFLVVTY